MTSGAIQIRKRCYNIASPGVLGIISQRAVSREDSESATSACADDKSILSFRIAFCTYESEKHYYVRQD